MTRRNLPNWTRRPGSVPGRRGAALVETAAICSVFLLLLFGVMEYCRYMFMRQIVANAAREGARYVVVRSYADTVDNDTKKHVLHYMGGLDGRVKNFTVQVYRGDANGNKVYAYDASGSNPYAYQTDGTGKYLETSGGSKSYIKSDSGGDYVLDGSTKVYVNLDPATQSVTGVNAGAFSTYASNQKIKGLETASTAAFGQYIVVQIDCDYNPVLPQFMFLNNTIRISTKAMMQSEAN